MGAMQRLFMSSVAPMALLCLLFGCGSKEGSVSASAASSGAPAVQAPATAQPTAAPAARTETPDAVAKSYLQLGSEGDLSKIKEIVDPACHATKIGDVDAVKMLGARMTLTDVTTTVESTEGDTAVVKYSVKGSVDSKGSHAETDIFGKKVDVKVGSMTMSGVTQSGTLKLKKMNGRWVVGC